MGAIDKLYNKDDKVVLRLDAFTDNEIKNFKEQIEMYIKEYEISLN